MIDETMPATLVTAIVTKSLWLRERLAVLSSAYVAMRLVVVRGDAGSWRIRFEPIAILSSFLGSAVLMSALYAQVGHVRLLGLAHFVLPQRLPAWAERYHAWQRGKKSTS